MLDGGEGGLQGPKCPTGAVEPEEGIFHFFTYLFGYGSQLWHMGFSVFIIACGIFSCSMRTFIFGLWDLFS